MEIRDLTVDDLDAVLDCRTRAFGVLSGDDAASWRTMVTPLMPEGRYLGVFDGTRLTGAGRVNNYVQWWHGRPISMGGIAGVTVAPEDRGRGVGRMLMRGLLARCADLGHAVSALYPATTQIYRSLGWEHAGARYRVNIPTEALRLLQGRAGGGVPLRRVAPDDAPEIGKVLDRVYGATRASGPLMWEERLMRHWLTDDTDYCYLADDGFLAYCWDGGDLDVDNLVAGSEATARALWALVGSSSSVARSVTATVEPDDPLLWLLRERKDEHISATRWMFRLVDLPAAVAARGYPETVSAETVVAVDDPERPANSGTWLLSVASGTATATRVPPPAESHSVPHLTIGGMSALFAGVQLATLRRAGLLTGGTPHTDETLSSVFAAKPYLIDYF
ncbi:GNAT family N-acetyltransferase [Sphaerisporangium aureirubrum]|uniref:Enhanced intracellular survival protein Eis n=1 Tax=Sphaerisporangium aureirubrum TaxID=1544736 RepID=A0ABW1NPB4_9ACTN